MARKKKVRCKSININEETHTELAKISAVTRIQLLALVDFAIPMLKEKFGIKKWANGDDGQ